MVLLLRETNKNHQNKKKTQQDIILQTKLGLKKRKSQKKDVAIHHFTFFFRPSLSLSEQQNLA